MQPVPNADIAVKNYLSAFSRKKDGTIGTYALGPREGLLMEVIEALTDHIKIIDGAGNFSEVMCRGCTHDRTVECPNRAVTIMLRELHRKE